MRITFVLPYAGMAGGIKVVAIYTRLLREMGHHVNVVSSTGAANYLISEYCGYLIPTEDPDAMAQRIVSFVEMGAKSLRQDIRLPAVMTRIHQPLPSKNYYSGLSTTIKLRPEFINCF